MQLTQIWHRIICVCHNFTNVFIKRYLFYANIFHTTRDHHANTSTPPTQIVWNQKSTVPFKIKLLHTTPCSLSLKCQLNWENFLKQGDVLAINNVGESLDYVWAEQKVASVHATFIIMLFITLSYTSFFFALGSLSLELLQFFLSQALILLISVPKVLCRILISQK